MDVVDVLIAGAGLAGARCAETLRSTGYDGTILMAGDESHSPYERPALSKGFLTGDRTAESLAQRPAGFWAEQAIDVSWGARVDEVDLVAQRARVGDRTVGWRHLVVATGSRARRLPGLPEATGLHHLRTLDDARALRAEMSPGARLVVIGAGFVGAEVASTARDAGLEVSIIEEAAIPLARVLGPDAGTRMAARMRQSSVDLRLGARLVGLTERGGRVRGVELAGGERLACDLVLVGVGAVPNTDIPGLETLGRADDGGLLADGCGRTEHPGVFACGDVASAWRQDLGCHRRREHWTAAAAGARAVAAAIAGEPRPDESESFFWSDQFGWRIQMVGESGGHLGSEVCEETDDGFLVRYRDAAGSVRGGLAVNRPDAVTALRREMQAAPFAAAAVGTG